MPAGLTSRVDPDTCLLLGELFLKKAVMPPTLVLDLWVVGQSLAVPVDAAADGPGVVPACCAAWFDLGAVKKRAMVDLPVGAETKADAWMNIDVTLQPGLHQWTHQWTLMIRALYCQAHTHVRVNQTAT